MKSHIMIVGPSPDANWSSPPWRLLNLREEIRLYEGDIVLVLRKVKGNNERVEVYHPASGMKGELEIDLLQEFIQPIET